MKDLAEFAESAPGSAPSFAVFPFGGIFRHGDTSINICAAGSGDHVTLDLPRPYAAAYARVRSRSVMHLPFLADPQNIPIDACGGGGRTVELDTTRSTQRSKRSASLIEERLGTSVAIDR